MGAIEKRMNATEFERFIEGCTVKTLTNYSNGESPMQGTGTVYRAAGGPLMIITAKHCLRGEKMKHHISDVSSIELDRSFVNIKVSVSVGEFEIIESPSDDLAIIIISEGGKAASLCPDELVWKIGVGEFREQSEFDGFGYPAKVAKSGAQKHSWRRVQGLDHNKNIQVYKCFDSLSPGDGSLGVEFIKGYSGTGLFLIGTISLCVVIVELLDKTGVHDRAIGVSASQINEVLNANGRKPIEETRHKLVTKNTYLEPEDYIHRTIETTSCPKRQVDNAYELFLEELEGTSLSQEMQEHDKIILLAEGGYGKSTDLEFLASQLSLEGDFYPVFLRLKDRGSVSIEDQIDTKFPDWKEVFPKSNIVILLDGYEEGGTHKDEFREGLLHFIDTHGCKVVVTCRPSHHVSSQWEGFAAYFLDTLRRKDIEAYVAAKLDSRKNDFMGYLSEVQLNELAKIPFYLVRLVDLFQSTDRMSLPKSKAEILNKLIRKKFAEDDKKYGRTPFQTAEIEDRLGIVENIALRMQELGLSKIGIDALRKFLVLEEIKNCQEVPVARLAEDGFSFDHDIFKDYFAAVALSKMSVTDALDRFTFTPDDPRLVPRFSPSVVFLIGLWKADVVKRNALIDHLSQHDPKFLLAIPISELGLAEKLAFFKNIFETFLQSGVGIEDFWNVSTIGDLAGTIETNRYLMESIRSGRINPAHYLPWKFLRPIDQNHDSQELVPFLHEFLQNPDSRFNSLKALETIRLLTQEDAKVFAREYFDSSKFQEREVALYLINNHNLSDDLVDLLFQEWDGLVDPNTLPAYGEEGFTGYPMYGSVKPFGVHWETETSSIYRRCLLNFRTEANILSLLDFCKRSDRYFHFVFGESGYELATYEAFWKAVTVLLHTTAGLFDTIYDLFIKALHTGQHTIRNVAKFFLIADQLQAILDRLVVDIQEDYFLERAIEAIVDEKLWIPIIEKFENRLISQRILFHVVAGTREPDRSKFRAIAEERTGIFSKTDRKNAEEKERRIAWEKQKLAIFLDDGQFMTEVERLLELAGVDSGFKGFVSGIWQVEIYGTNSMNGIFSDAISNIHHYRQSYDPKIIEAIYRANRAEILLSSIQQLYKGEQEVLEPFRDEIQILINSLFPALKGGSSVRSAGAGLVYSFWHNFEFDVPEDSLLDLTLHEIPDMLPERSDGSWEIIRIEVGYQAFAARIIQNLQEAPLSDRVLNAHLVYCRVANLTQSANIILSLLETDDWNARSSFVHDSALDAVVFFAKGNDHLLEKLLEKAQLEENKFRNRHLFKILIRRKNPKMVPILEELLDGDDADARIEAAFDLLHFGSPQAMRVIVDWYLASKEDRRTFEFERINDSLGVWMLPFLLELLPEFVGQDQMPKQRYSIPALILEILRSGEQYEDAITQLEQSLRGVGDTNPQLKWSLERIIAEGKRENSERLYEKRMQ